MRWALAVLFVTGCDHVLQLDDIQPKIDAFAGIGTCLDETFDGDSVDTSRWYQFTMDGPPSPQLSQAGGDLVIALAMGTPSATHAYNGLQSRATYSLTGGGWIEVQLVELPADMNAEVQLYASIDGLNEYLVSIGGGLLRLKLFVNGIDTEVPVAFDPTMEHYVRIRAGADDGNVYIDTASTAGAWNQRIMHAAPLSFDILFAGVDAGTFLTGATSPQTARFDNLVVRAYGCPP